MTNPTTAAEMREAAARAVLAHGVGVMKIRPGEVVYVPAGDFLAIPIPSDDEMVEKVARAIKESLGAAMGARPLHGDASSGDWHAEPSGVIDLTDVARAAIAAMRGEP